MSHKLLRCKFPVLCVGVLSLAVMAAPQFEKPGSAAPESAAADDPLLSIEVKAVARDARPTERKYPKHYENFEKRIEELDGKPVLDLLGSKLSIRLLNNAPRRGGRKEPYTGADFVCAILRGKIVLDSQMVYALQDSQECLVTTSEGDFKVGIYYPPVGYVVLPNGECYWFMFEKSGT